MGKKRVADKDDGPKRPRKKAGGKGVYFKRNCTVGNDHFRAGKEYKGLPAAKLKKYKDMGLLV